MRATILAVLALLATAAPAAASPEQESIFQDDPLIVFHPNQQRLDEVLGQLATLGVDRIRVPIFWHTLAPRASSARRPRFRRPGPQSPRAYSQRKWARYDRVMKTAAKVGIGTLVTISPSIPLWARSGSRRRPKPYPRARDLRAFAQAVGTRYSGAHPDPTGEVPALPRVTHWSFWNEPNFLQFDARALLRRKGGARPRPMTPAVYRGVVDALYSGLRRSGHGDDTFLLGETAPRRGGRRDPNGTIPPLDFVRGVYCLNRRLRPQRGCRRGFVSRHPGLFRSAGWAHHPYTVNLPPDWTDRAGKAIPIKSIPRLVRTLDQVMFRWGEDRRIPVWVTEYGIQTNPPDPTLDIDLVEQADYLARSEFLNYANDRVASTAWFLLVDDAPRRTPRGRSKRALGRRWVTWQSGLATRRGTLKPSFREYVAPIQARGARAGRPVRVFGQYRPAPDGTPIPARVEFGPRGGPFQTLTAQTVANVKGYLDVEVTPPAAGFLRIVWTDPRFGSEFASREVRVR